MRYRKLDADGDFVFGHAQNDFLVNSPDAVAQAVKTRLLLAQGEWFLDTTEGTPYNTEILGTGTQTTYDLAIRERVLLTQGVKSIEEYTSTRNRDTRALTVTLTIDTIYGTATLTQVL